MIATLIVWALIFVAAALAGRYALVAALIACVVVLVAAGFIGGSVLGRFPMIETLIVLALGVGGGVALVWWALANSLKTDCGFSCGGGSVSNAPGP